MIETFIEVLRPILREPLPEFDSAGNYRNLAKTTDGEYHNYLIASDFEDQVSETYIKNNDKCLHLSLAKGQFTDILYYSSQASIPATAKEITVKKTVVGKNGIPEIKEVPGTWIDVQNHNNMETVTELLLFSKDDLISFLTKYIRADETNDITNNIFKIYETDDIFRIVGIVTT